LTSGKPIVSINAGFELSKLEIAKVPDEISAQLPIFFRDFLFKGQVQYENYNNFPSLLAIVSPIV
jgi:hypothetical protein